MLAKNSFSEVSLWCRALELPGEIAQAWAQANPGALAILTIKIAGTNPSRSAPPIYIIVQGEVHPTETAVVLGEERSMYGAHGQAGFCAGCGRFLEAGEFTIARTTMGTGPELPVRHIVQGPWCPDCGPQDGTRYARRGNAVLVATQAEFDERRRAREAGAQPEPTVTLEEQYAGVTGRRAWRVLGTRVHQVQLLEREDTECIVRLEDGRVLLVPEPQVHTNVDKAYRDARGFNRHQVAMGRR